MPNRADLRERTKTMIRHDDRRVQFADFRDSFETINWLYLLCKCGIKTKTHFEWLLWHWSSLGQLNLEPTRPNGLVGCKVPTDLVKISVKEATHMGLYYITVYQCAESMYTMLTKNYGHVILVILKTGGVVDKTFCQEIICYTAVAWINPWYKNNELFPISWTIRFIFCLTFVTW